MSIAQTSLDQIVSSALEQSPYLSTRQLRFETNQGTVVLRGVVPSYYQKQMAQETVRRIDGVDEVINQLEVNWSPAVPETI